MDIGKWYHGLELPKTFHDTGRNEQFVQGVMGIFSAVMAGDFDTKVSVYLTNDPEIQIAAADMENRKIYFSRSLISPDPTKRLRPEANFKDVLAAIVGITLHESLHFKHTTVSAQELFTSIGVDNVSQLLFTIFNIVEDIYIDQWGYDNIEVFNWATEKRLNYLFTQEKFCEYVDSMALYDADPKDIEAYVNALACLKNFFLDVPSGPDKWNKLSKMMVASTSLDSIFDRARHAKAIYDLLLGDIDQDDQEQAEQSGSDAEGAAYEKESAFSLTEQYTPSDAQDGDPKDEKQLNSDSEIESSADASGRHYTSVKIVLDSSEIEKMIESVYQNDYVVPTEFDKRYVGLARLIAARSIVNKPYGPQRDRGRSIRQLHRIATDSKIFAEKSKIESVGQQEIIILIDCSGSMGRISMGKTYIAAAVEAAYGAAVGLESGRHRVAVYGHSADIAVTGSIVPELLIYQFKSFDESVATMRGRVEAFNAVSDRLCLNNSDSLAIRYVGGEFSKLNNTKTLIVISDGIPESSFARGAHGVEKAKKEVSDVKRRVGCKVLSISISSGSIKENDEIYGETNNTNNESSNVVTEILNKMFQAH